MISQLTNKIIKYNNKKNLFAFLKVNFILTTIFLALFLLIITFENIFFFHKNIREYLYYSLISIVFIYLLLILIFAVKYLIRVFKFDLHQLAYEIGFFYDDIKDRIGNALQLYQKNPENSLINENLKLIINKFEKIEPANLIKFYQIQKEFYVFISVFFIAFILSFTSFQDGFKRIIHYSDKSYNIEKYKFVILKSDKILKYGENYQVILKVYDNLSHKYLTTFFKPVKFVVKKINQPDFVDYQIRNIKNDTLFFNLKNPDIDFTFFFEYNNVKSDKYDVKIVNEPLITKSVINIKPPAYTKISEYKEIDNGNITVPKGSKLTFDILASEQINNAFIKTPAKLFDMSVQGNKAIGNLNIYSDLIYSINLTSTYNIPNKPVEYKIKVLQDEPPTLNVILPKYTHNKISNNRLECLLDVSDDYGLSKLTINYKVTVSKYTSGQSNFSSIEIPINNDLNSQTINYIWNFSKLALVPGEEVTFYFEVFDNDAISGFKSTKSSLYTIKVPDIDEIFTENQQDLNQFQRKIENTIKEFNEIKEELNKIKKELKQDKPELTWQEKEKLQKTIEKYEKLQQKVQELKKEFSDIKNNSLENNLLSKETLEKYLELQELMKEFTSEEYRKVLERMQKSLENLNRQQVQNELKNFEFNEEMFKKSIERTLNLLKRIQIEQKFDEINKRIENLKEQLNNLNNNLENAANKDEILKQQKELQQQIKELNKQLDNLKNKMKEFNDLPNKELGELLDKNNPDDNENLISQAISSMQTGNSQQAKNSQSNLNNNLSNLQKGLSSLKQQMMQKNQQETVNKMLKIINNLIDISKDQEKLRNKTNNSRNDYTQFSNLAIEQYNIQENLNRTYNIMNELAQKSFMITPEVANLLGNALREMQNSINYLSNVNAYNSTLSQNQVIKNLNELAKLMSNTLKNMAQGQSGGAGSMSLMQQFQQMIQQQMQINQLTQQLASGQQLSQEQLQLARRLQQQQEIIRKSLEQMQQEAKSTGQSKKLPSNLDKLANEIQEVINDMRSNKFDDKLVQKQERILSRMLDATKSINDRDYEEKREKELSQQKYKGSQNKLKFYENNQPTNNNSIDNLIREGYNEEYLKLIQNYFKLINK
ncbi:MAG TPA: hypothetical protein PLP99_08395 [Ignavibacteriales bacterium]|nr:hypothetical protein [Ignavibacteriales bacterium]HOL81760.1 hypothetical protein [Ignavibacteriales bacterium]